MRTVRVTDSSGVEWQVRVEWAPRHRALVRRFGAWRRGKKGMKPGSKKDSRSSRWDWFPDIPIPDGPIGGVILALLLALAVVLLLWWVVLPLLFLLLDALVVLVLLVLGLGVRVLLRRPWTVLATAGEHRRELEVVGWKRSLRARDGVAAGLKTGGEAAWPSLALRRWDS